MFRRKWYGAGRVLSSGMRGFVLELRSFEADIVPVFVADKSPEQHLSNNPAPRLDLPKLNQWQLLLD